MLSSISPGHCLGGVLEYFVWGGLCATCGNALRLPVFCAQAAGGLEASLTWGRRIWSICVYIYIHAYNLIRWTTLRLQKVKKQRER